MTAPAPARNVKPSSDPAADSAHPFLHVIRAVAAAVAAAGTTGQRNVHLKTRLFRLLDLERIPGRVGTSICNGCPMRQGTCFRYQVALFLPTKYAAPYHVSAYQCSCRGGLLATAITIIAPFPAPVQPHRLTLPTSCETHHSCIRSHACTPFRPPSVRKQVATVDANPVPECAPDRRRHIV